MPLNNQWKVPPQEPFLANNEVHVWCATLDQPLARQTQLEKILSSDEYSRAKRFRFEDGRRHFIAGRALLRVLLGRYLHSAPERIQFAYTTNGKPFLVLQGHTQGIEFNVSHSHTLALYAFVQHHAVGVDIEYMHTLPDADAIVDHFFSVQEQRVFHALPTEQQLAAFFAGWTRKEAYLKACGDGLMVPLSQFEVSLAPEEAARILAIEGDVSKADGWFLHDLAIPDAMYKAAVVLKGNKQWQIKYWLYE